MTTVNNSLHAIVYLLPGYAVLCRWLLWQVVIFRDVQGGDGWLQCAGLLLQSCL